MSLALLAHGEPFRREPDARPIAAYRPGPGADVNGRRGEEALAFLVERSADLMRDLVDFACSPRPARYRSRGHADWPQPPYEIMIGHGLVR
jgi:hypothetical protein